jgi:hypothetical protein
LELQAFIAGGWSANQEKTGPKWMGLLYSITGLLSVILLGSFGVHFMSQYMQCQDCGTMFGLNAHVNALGATTFLSFYN